MAALDPCKRPPAIRSRRDTLCGLLGLGASFAIAIGARGQDVALGAPSAGRTPPPFSGLTTSDEVVAHIRAHEGLRLEAYQDPRGAWLIGYGHAATATAGLTITAEEAEQLLRRDLRAKEAVIARHVRVALDRDEFSALVSFVYTLGEGNFARSRALRYLNAGDRAAAADALRNWTRTRVGDELVPVPGLVARRETERAIFLGLPRP